MSPYTIDVFMCLEAIGKIESYQRHESLRFEDSPLLQDAILRNLQVLFEATLRLPDTLKSAHPEIPWQAMITLRNTLAHDSIGLDLKNIEAILRRDLEPLKKALLAHQ